MSNIEQAPERFCINSEKLRSSSLSFIGNVIFRLHNDTAPLTIDLSDVKFASAAASVLLFAVINRAYFVLEGKAIPRIIQPKKEENPDGYRWIVSTGLAKALLANNSTKLAALVEQKRYFQSSVDPEKSLTATMEMLKDKALLDPEQETMLMMGINEAMLNIKNHAYETPDLQNIVDKMGGKRWWQCSWFDPENDRVVFIICDLGMGIATSYSNEEFDSRTQFILEQNQVVEALTSGNSRYQKAGRGNGSEDIKRPVAMAKTRHEKLMVFTQNSLYVLDSDFKGKEPIMSILKPSIPGTIIHWTLAPKRG
ncbi:hypothetical protein PZA20_11935 [Pectobacterium polaris]|uniref:hypothetical protein n=1 Tax=Pectobacterium polaris TaxID=2042057 RepID=UPI0023AECF09|nr:hypothetical protein [Pectobacterium polaris]MDE8742531.1 hypothetical protein [Pectobacterium polaris]